MYCNCIDENGEVGFEQKDFDTVIKVDCDLIHKAFCEKQLYFLEGSPKWSNDNVNVYEKPSSSFFYRGINVKQIGNVAQFTYNVLSNVDLTEDRTAKYDHHFLYPIQRFVQLHADENFCRKFLTADANSFEGKMPLEPTWGCSDAFYNTVQNLIHSDIGVRESARNVVKKRDQTAGVWPEFYLTDVQVQMLNKSKSFLRKIGINVSMFEIKCVQGLGDGVMGRAFEGSIYLSELPFNMGTKQLAGTLLEEWVHIKHSCEDFDRRMQNWLFDKVISLGEEINGEPI